MILKLLNGLNAQIDQSDYDIVSQTNWSAKLNHGNYYVTRVIRINGKHTTIWLHRFLLNAPSGQEVDHVNHDTLDNRRENLRLCTTSQNQANQLPQQNCMSKYKGVQIVKNRKKKYRSRIKQYGILHHIGYFLTEEEAALAYNEKAKEMFGEFAYLNTISP